MDCDLYSKIFTFIQLESKYKYIVFDNYQRNIWEKHIPVCPNISIASTVACIIPQKIIALIEKSFPKAITVNKVHCDMWIHDAVKNYILPLMYRYMCTGYNGTLKFTWKPIHDIKSNRLYREMMHIIKIISNSSDYWFILICPSPRISTFSAKCSIYIIKLSIKCESMLKSWLKA